MGASDADAPFLDYELPPERIAQEPAEPRDASRLLLVDRARGALTDYRFRDLPELLAPGDLIVVNDSRVVSARIAARRSSGGRVEILLLEEREERRWRALVRPLARLRVGEELIVLDRDGRDSDRRVCFEGRSGDLGFVRLDAQSVVDAYGQTPLPPYIRRVATGDDRERYQTVYADRDGSAAAPTAGLHFTEGLIERCRSRGIRFARLTLHVGIDTFRPITTDNVASHRMHSEWYSVPAETWRDVVTARAAGRRVVSVGTTTTRVLETVAGSSDTAAALTGRTSIYIRPPYTFNAVGAQITNFHLPRTTLLLMIGAFAGNRLMRSAYRHAIDHDYRFYSFGDAMLIV